MSDHQQTALATALFIGTVGIIIFYGIATPLANLTNWQATLVNIAIMLASGAFGFLFNRLKTQKPIIQKQQELNTKLLTLRVHTKTHYRTLRRAKETFSEFWQLSQDATKMTDLTPPPFPTERQKAHENLVQYISGQSLHCSRTIDDCIQSWKDIAPDDTDQVNNENIG